MLKTIRVIVDDKKKYNEYGKNCSATVLTVLYGRTTKAIKKYQDTSSILFKTLTPQNVYDVASDMECEVLFF